MSLSDLRKRAAVAAASQAAPPQAREQVLDYSSDGGSSCSEDELSSHVNKLSFSKRNGSAAMPRMRVQHSDGPLDNDEFGGVRGRGDEHTHVPSVGTGSFHSSIGSSTADSDYESDADSTINRLRGKDRRGRRGQGSSEEEGYSSSESRGSGEKTHLFKRDDSFSKRGKLRPPDDDSDPPVAIDLSKPRHPPRPSHKSSINAAQSIPGIKPKALRKTDQLKEPILQDLEFGAELGRGAFGVVSKATMKSTRQVVAVKKLVIDPNFQNRELQILKQLYAGDNPCIIELIRYYRSVEGSRKVEYLHLVFEFMPAELYAELMKMARRGIVFPRKLYKAYAFQLLRSIAYLRCFSIVHRDIKPQNILCNPQTGALKLTDFGCAKTIKPGEKSVTYICSRFYRAPELVLGKEDYDSQVDVWAVGCTLFEMLAGRPLFPAESQVDMMVNFIRVLGTPTQADLQALLPQAVGMELPERRKKAWAKLYGKRGNLAQSAAPPGADDLLDSLLIYNPSIRTTAVRALASPFFDELRAPGATLENGVPFPPRMFDLTFDEAYLAKHLLPRIVPENHYDEKTLQAWQERYPVPVAERETPPSSRSSLPPLEDNQAVNMSSRSSR